MSHNDNFEHVIRPDIDATIGLIKQLHERQTDHSGQPYVGHPQRVADNVRLINPLCGDDTVMAALLHDTIEDCGVGDDFLRNKGYCEDCITMVVLLTKPKNDFRSYDQVIEGLISSGNRGAMLVKLADNMDNMHPERRKELSKINSEKAEKLGNKYMRSIEKLTTALGMDKHSILSLINSAQPLVGR